MKPHRNHQCPCGSGKKYKRCCMEVSVKDPEFYRRVEQERQERVARLVAESQSNNKSEIRQRRRMTPVMTVAMIAAMCSVDHR